MRAIVQVKKPMTQNKNNELEEHNCVQHYTPSFIPLAHVLYVALSSTKSTTSAILRRLNTRRLLIPLALAATLGSTGCYKATFFPDPSAVRGETHEEWSDFYVFGLVGTEHFDVSQFCKDGQAAMVRTGGNFGTGLVSVITIGIYTPRKVYVTCAAGTTHARAFEIDATRDGHPVRALVYSGSRRIPLAIEQLGATAFRLRELGGES